MKSSRRSRHGYRNCRFATHDNEARETGGRDRGEDEEEDEDTSVIPKQSRIEEKPRKKKIRDYNN